MERVFLQGGRSIASSGDHHRLGWDGRDDTLPSGDGRGSDDCSKLTLLR